MAKKDVELRFSLKDGVSAGLKSIQGAVGGIATSIAKVGPAAVAAGAALATVGIGAALTQGVQDAAAFEQQLARIGATAGLTAEELGQVKAAIEGAAAGSTATISETAAAFQTLAAEGLSASEAIAALPNTLALATAAQISTQEAAGALAATLDQFGLSADQAAKSADVIATAALQGGTGVNQLLQAFEQVGPVARNAGLSLEETAAAVALLAQNGIEGGKAGGALRAILDGLADPASRLSVELSKIGISSRDFSTVIEQLGAKGAAAQGAINALGSRGTAALQALLREGGGSIDQLIAKFQQSQGAAQEFADKIENSLPGSFENLKQAFADVQAKFFEPLLAPIKTEVGALESQIRDFAASPEFAKLQTAFLQVFVAATKAVREFIAEFDFSGALVSFSQFTTDAGKEISALLDKVDKLATAFKVVKAAVEVVPNALDSAASAAGGAAAKLGALVSAPLGMISDDGEQARQKLDALGNEGFANVSQQASNFSGTLRSLIGTVSGANTEIEEHEGRVSRAGRAHANLTQETLAASRAADGSAVAFQKGAAAVGDLGDQSSKSAGDVQALKSELIALENGIAQAINAGSAQEAIDILVERANRLRENIAAIEPVADKSGKALKKAGDDGAQAFDNAASSASQAASDIESTGEAAQQSATMAAEGTASLSGITAALFSKYSALSEAAGNFFADTQKAANVGSLSLQDYGEAIQAADRATQAAFDGQTSSANALISTLQEYAQTGRTAADSTAAAFFQSEGALDGMEQALQQGIAGFDLLDRQTLQNLQSAIDAARAKTKQLSADARQAVADLKAIGDQLEDQALRDAGNEEEIARRDYERKIQNIEEIEKRAGAAGADGAERAKRLAREDFERKMRDIQEAKAAQAEADREAADNRIAENQRVWDNDPYNPNNTAPAPTQQQGQRTTAGRGGAGAITGGKGDNVAVNINVDRLQSVGGNKRDLEELVRMLKPHFEALARRTR